MPHKILEDWRPYWDCGRKLNPHRVGSGYKQEWKFTTKNWSEA